jgi:hypothetical protein
LISGRRLLPQRRRNPPRLLRRAGIDGVADVRAQVLDDPGKIVRGRLGHG